MTKPEILAELGRLSLAVRVLDQQGVQASQFGYTDRIRDLSRQLARLS